MEISTCIYSDFRELIVNRQTFLGGMEVFLKPVFFLKHTIEEVIELWVFIAYANSKGSDEPLHLYSLIRVFPQIQSMDLMKVTAH